MFEYDPKGTSWPDGDYIAEIYAAVDKVSKKSGKPMIELVWQVFWKDKTKMVFDWIGDWNLGRLRDLCVASGIDFAGGNVDPAEFVGKRFKVALGTREYKNRVVSFEPFDSSTNPNPPDGSAATGDGIPF